MEVFLVVFPYNCKQRDTQNKTFVTVFSRDLAIRADVNKMLKLNMTQACKRRLLSPASVGQRIEFL